MTDEEIQGFTATLTTSQAAVVQRRVNSLSATFRAKQKHKIDVRDIFPEQTDSQVLSNPSTKEKIKHCVTLNRGEVFFFIALSVED